MSSACVPSSTIRCGCQSLDSEGKEKQEGHEGQCANEAQNGSEVGLRGQLGVQDTTTPSSMSLLALLVLPLWSRRARALEWRAEARPDARRVVRHPEVQSGK